MKPSKALIIVSILAGLMAVIQAGAGVFWHGSGSPFSFTTLHGDSVEMYGRGIYAFDTYFKAPINRGTDFITLFLCVPALVVALVLYSRSASLRSKIFLAGMLAMLLYNAASVAFGTAYNNLFLVYIVYFSTSLFAFLMAYGSIDLNELGSRASARVPRKGIAGLMFFSAAGLFAAWLPDIVISLLNNTVPNIASYTTEITHVIDLGIIVPTCILSGIAILRRQPLGYLLSALLMIVLVVIGVMVTTQTIFQSQAGITLSTGEFIGKAGSFMVLALVAVGLVIGLFRGIDGSAPARKSSVRARAAKA